MKFSSTAIATLAITAPSDRAWGFSAEQEQEDSEHISARFWCRPRPSPPTEPSPSVFPSTAPVEVPTTSPVPSTEPSQFPSLEPTINPASSQAPTPTCMPEFENFDEVCENWLQNTLDFLATPSCRTPCDEWEGFPEANFVLSEGICSNCIADENGDEYCIYTSRDEYRFIGSPSSDWDEMIGDSMTFHQSGSLSSGSTVQFFYAYNYSAYQYNPVYPLEKHICRVVVDEMECNSCTLFFNTTGHLWWDVDCSNTPSVDSPTRVDLDSYNIYREPTISYDHPLFALTDRAFEGICYKRWFPEDQAPSAAPVEGDCVPTSGFDEELCDWYTAIESSRECLNPCDDWVGKIRSNIAFLNSGCSGCFAGDNGEEYCVEKDYITYYLSRDFNASAAAEWPYSWARMELGTSVRFNQTGLASSDAVVEYITYDKVWPEECDVKIDGQLCNSCTVYYERDFVESVTHKGLTVDCSNVEGVDAAVSFNLTDDWKTSYTLEFYRGLLEPEVPMDHPLFALTARVQLDNYCGGYILPPIDEAPSAAPVEGDCDPESGYDEELCNARLGGNCANPCDDWPGEIRSNIVRYPGWYDCSGCANEGEEDEYCLDMTQADYYLSFGFNASDPSWTRGTDYLDLADAYIFNSSGINSHVVTLTYDSHVYDACWVTVDGEYCDSCVEKDFRIYPVDFDGIEVDCRNLGIGDAPFQFNYRSGSSNSNDPEVPMNHTLYALTNRARWGVCEGNEEGRLPVPAHDKPAVINDQDRQPRPFMAWRRFGNFHPNEEGRV